MESFAWNDPRIVEAYQRDGVVRIRGLFVGQQLQAIRQQIERYGREQMAQLPAGDYTLESDGKTIRNLWRMELYDPFFEHLSKQAHLIAGLAPLLNGTVVRTGVETFHKSAQVGSQVPYHQDNAYFCQTPADMLSLWVAIDPATVENGAVIYLPGSHQTLQPHRPSGVRGNSYGLVKLPTREEVAHEEVAVLEAGDALIHHCQVIHRSEPNRSPSGRLALVMVYRGAHTQTDPRLKHAYEQARAMV